MTGPKSLDLPPQKETQTACTLKCCSTTGMHACDAAAVHGMQHEPIRQTLRALRCTHYDLRQPRFVCLSLRHGSEADNRASLSVQLHLAGTLQLIVGWLNTYSKLSALQSPYQCTSSSTRSRQGLCEGPLRLSKDRCQQPGNLSTHPLPPRPPGVPMTHKDGKGTDHAHPAQL